MKTFVLSAIIALVAAAPVSASAEAPIKVVKSGEPIPRTGDVFCTHSGHFFKDYMKDRPAICTADNSLAESWKKKEAKS